MPFSEAAITSILPPTWQGSDLQLSWTSTSPAGTFYQVYINRTLTWWGTSKFAVIVMPPDTITIDIGTVGPGESTLDFSADLPPMPSSRAVLNWFGGTFEELTLSGFFVYGSDAPGGAVDFTTELANISAYTGPPTDGWDLGPWDVGGWGLDAASYSWESGTLASGLWSFAVVPYDSAGNLGTPTTVAVNINSPPIEPAPFAGSTDRLRYVFNSASEEATLTWNSSPSA
jgi:hypothetical protein